MKKFFKRGMLALALVGGMTFAAPQHAAAAPVKKHVIGETIVYEKQGADGWTYYLVCFPNGTSYLYSLKQDNKVNDLPKDYRQY